MQIISNQFPAKSFLAGTSYHYSDSFSGQVKKDFEIETAAKAFFQTAPGWVDSLMRLRNRIVRLFGLKAPTSKQDPAEILNAAKWEPGEEIGLFKIYNKSENEIIFGQDDKHLNFRISLLKDHNLNKTSLILTTTVVFNNLFGRMYFLPVRFFHKPIVKAMMQSLIRELSKDKSPSPH